MFRKRKQKVDPVPEEVEVQDATQIELENPVEQPVGFEPLFPRLSTHRRVLAHVTPEVDRDSEGPRNTLSALTAGLIRDEYTAIFYPEQVPPFLNELVAAGLLEESEGVYTVTEAGWRELTN